MSPPRQPVNIAPANPTYRLLIVAVALILLALIAAALLANVNRTPKPFILHPAPGVREEPRVSDIAVPNLVEPVTAGEAIQQNQKRPFDALPDTPAQPFVLHADDESRERAITCLAQAAYYEAGAEGEDGERAVVQVVLNRLRRPGFPSTLCGVVYQGSELPTGCQFTFTCNGSLDREPSPAGWRQARQIAVAALDGKVFAGIGHATHFHANYVLPYWADSFAKQVQIGTHIFYRLKGALGSSAAFSQRYGGSEPAIPSRGQINPLIQSPVQAASLVSPEVLGTPELAADRPVVALADTNIRPLLADEQKGTLIAEGNSAQIHQRQVKRPQDCGSSDTKQIKPADPNDLRLGHSAIRC
jgi:spore germination cell wall hydrolase CwlJ-like protein